MENQFINSKVKWWTVTNSKLEYLSCFTPLAFEVPISPQHISFVLNPKKTVVRSTLCAKLIVSTSAANSLEMFTVTVARAMNPDFPNEMLILRHGMNVFRG